jgi:hypothetical protein
VASLRGSDLMVRYGRAVCVSGALGASVGTAPELVACGVVLGVGSAGCGGMLALPDPVEAAAPEVGNEARDAVPPAVGVVAVNP